MAKKGWWVFCPDTVETPTGVQDGWVATQAECVSDIGYPDTYVEVQAENPTEAYKKGWGFLRKKTSSANNG